MRGRSEREVRKMQMVKIRFAEKDQARGLVELARRVKVICLPDDEYLIAQPNLSLLNQLGLAHEVLGTEGMDTKEKTEILTDHPHIVRVEGVCGGEPIISGTRVTVRAIFEYYRLYESVGKILEALPFLTRERVLDALLYSRDHPEEIGRLMVEEEIADWEDEGIRE
jgi:uncharacterized protein (DUF433 family)